MNDCAGIKIDGRALVLGAGVSGVAAARLMRARGGSAVVIDEAADIGQRAQAALAACGTEFYGGIGSLPPGKFDFCIVSPSFAPQHRWLEECRTRGIPLISELELGARYWHGRILAVTGSKGKSSLVKLCADTLNMEGMAAAPGGNYGTPLSELALDARHLRWAVVEVSSFQMELTKTFAPDVAVLLNFQADHLDRHGTMEEYRRLKERLFAFQPPGAFALLPAGYEQCHGEVLTAARKATFGGAAGAQWRYLGGAVRTPQGEIVPMGGTWFDNDVLGEAAAAAAAALSACGVTNGVIAAGLHDFRPLPHRMEVVAESGGVAYIDNSKATSLAALGASLRMARRPVRLVAGGRLKEPDLAAVKELLTKHTKKVYLIGECACQMLECWRDAAPCELCGTVENAVARAHAEATAGEAVLLAPGTASFDQFKSYGERGECFARAVRQVTGVAMRSE